MVEISEYLEILLRGRDMDFQQSKDLLDTVFQGGVPDVQIAAFLTAMRMKKATADEFAGLAQSLRDHSVKVDAGIENLIDTCGTGGAKLKTFNISTAAAFVAAGAGAYVAKHGNRGITSKCGSADVLEALGVKLVCEPELIAESIRRAHIGFMYAPMFHPAMKFVQHIRKSLNFRTVFNLLGPMANPAGVSCQVMGTADETLLERTADTLEILGSKRAMVVHGGGLDEISTACRTSVVELRASRKISYQIDPAELGIAAPNMDELAGGDARYNAAVIKGVLSGKNKGAARDIVLLNAAAAIMVAGLSDGLESAMKTAAESIDNGSAMGSLQKMVEITNEKE